MKEAILGVDVGTSSCKAVVFDSLGLEISRATSATYQNNSPQPGWVEQDPEEVWNAVLQVMAETVKLVKDDYQIGSVCLAAQSGSLIPADHDGNPVYPLLTWLDGRSEVIVQDWKASGLEKRVKSLSGWSLYPGLPLPTIAWIKANLPEIFADSRHYFSVNDLFAFRLTGERISNPSNAGGMQLLDITSGTWQPELCQLAGITPDQLSKIQPSSTIIGEIENSICRQVGLPAGTPLINGGHDQGCTALGLGITEPGKLLLACGTAWVFTAISADPSQSILASNLDLNYHVVPDRWTISQSLGGLGASLEWFLEQAWEGSRSERYASLDQLLKTTEPNQELFFIPLTGGHDDPATTRSGGFAGLQLHHSRVDMARAVMESAGYELLWALESLQGSEQEIEELFLVGGAASSPVWPQILADILGLPIHIPGYDNWPAVGAAVLAGLSTGIFENPQQAAKIFHKDSKMLKPGNQRSAAYRNSFKKYRQITEQIRDF
jgi:xylulokinase